MISFLRGRVVAVSDSRLLIDVNDVGFSVGITSRDAVNIPAAGEIVTIFTHMNVKEDDISLFGFLDQEDLEMYQMLIKVSGIGPKGGLAILSTLSSDDLRFAVLSDDSASISKAPGIGPKTAKKLILELKDKISLQDAFERKSAHAAEAEAGSANVNASDDAVQALVALGYSGADAMKAVRKVEVTDDMDSGDILRQALKFMR